MTGAHRRDRDGHVLELLDGALDLPADERESWVREQAKEDPELAAEVLGLLSAQDAPGVLDRAPILASGPTRSASGAVGEGAGPGMDVDTVAAALADRYDRFEPIGRGGMALVFSARERKHDRAVVLKVLRPEIAHLYGEERFLREVHLASKLSHPHIIPFIDSGRAAGLLYYVMPWIEGETLHDRIRREGRISAEAARPLLRDVAEALVHAHAKGVVHRDLKPPNVLISGEHAYLLDFGVAKAPALEGDDGLTREGFSPGTPKYMAPEQFIGGPGVGPPADVFAWGCVALETLTGTPRLRADSKVGLAGALARLVPDLPAGQAELIERTLRPDPRERPTMLEVRDALEGLAATVHGVAGVPGGTARAPRRRWTAALVIAALLATVTVLVTRRADTGFDAPISLPIAVAGFSNETGDPSLDFLGRLAGDLVTQGLRELGIAVVPWSVSRDIVERAPVDSAADPIRLLGGRANAGSVVTGRYYRVGDDVSFRADLTDANAEVLLVASDPVTSPIERPQEAIEELRDRIMGSVSALTGARTAALQDVARRAPTFDAYRSFDQGLVHYLAQEYGDATDAFRMAHRADTMFLTPLLYAASTASNQGNRALVDTLVTFLEPRRSRLSRYDDFRWQVTDALLRDDRPTALRALRMAVELAPGSRAAYNLAVISNQLNRPGEALKALSTLDPDVGAVRGWAQYWTQRAHALHLLGRFDEEADAAREMAERHPERSVAPVIHARALAAAGRLDDLEAVLAQSALRPARTYWSHGGALTAAAEELIAHGPPGAAEPFLSRAASWLDQQIEAEPDYLAHRYWKASVLYDWRRWEEAAHAAEELVAANPESATYRGMAAVAAARLGDEATATRHLEDDAWDGSEGTRLLYSSRTHAVLGDRERAADQLAAALGRGVGGLSWALAFGHHDFELLRQDPRGRRLLEPLDS